MGKRRPKNKSKKKNEPGQWQHNSPVKAKKFLGQHFLRDEEIAAAISNSLSLNGYHNVIEIGPGTGVLTKHLLSHDLNLVAMELDADAVVYLNHSFPLENANIMHRKGFFKVVEADFLKYDLNTLFGKEPFAIIGNFPYNISTQIVFRLLDFRHLVPEFSGMFQKEVAQRICSGPGSKTYGILSVLVQAFYDAEYLFSVPPEVFDPPPKVSSGVLRLVRKTNYELDCDEKLFYKVVKAAFNQRRKTLRNSLKVFELSPNLKEDAIFDRRPEQMTVADFIWLTKEIADDTL